MLCLWVDPHPGPLELTEADYGMKSLLNEREQTALKVACDIYRERFGREPTEDPNLFIHLGDTPPRFLCWSAISGKIPTFRTSSGFLYHPAAEVWLTPREKLAALGFPVTVDVAESMGVPMVPVADSGRASSVAGNSFQFCSAAVVAMVALCCHKDIESK